jgi:hypothetical protein
LNFKLFCQIHLVPLRIGFGHQNKFCSLQNSEELLFWWNFGSSSTFGRILQNHKTGWLELATVLEQGGCSAAGAEPLRPVPPRAWPRSCLAA